MYQEQASDKMQISRATFGRILTTARRKIVDALINGKGVVVEGGDYAIDSQREGCRFWQTGRKNWVGHHGN
jgi:uncharacterized protein